MKNIPALGQNQQITGQILPNAEKTAVEKVVASADKAKITTSDASVLDLPKARTTKAANPDAVQDVLSSFLSGLDKTEGQDLATAHSGLDPSRVSDLLSSD